MSAALDRHEVCEIVGERLRIARENAGLTQQELGEAIGVEGKGAAVEISRYERGSRLPRVDRLYALANALGITPSSILGGSETELNPRQNQPSEVAAVAESAPKKKKKASKRKTSKSPKKAKKKAPKRVTKKKKAPKKKS